MGDTCRWIIGEKQIGVWNDVGNRNLHLSATVINPPISRPITIERPPGLISGSLYSYNSSELLRVFGLFRSVIEANLRETIPADLAVRVLLNPRENVSMAVGLTERSMSGEADLAAEIGCCVPPLVTKEVKNRQDNQPVDHLEVALFGHWVQNAQGQKIIDRAWWGVSNRVTRVCTRLHITEISAPIQEYLLNTLVHRYPVDIYGTDKRFRVVATLGPDGKIEALALELLSRFSLYNLRQTLNEEEWALSLVTLSTDSMSYGYCQNYRAFQWLKANTCPATIERCNTGHAMIACEGVENGRQFLEYFHIARERGGRSHEASVKVQTEHDSRCSVGYSWAKSRETVQGMRVPVKSGQGRLVPFAIEVPLVESVAVPAVQLVSISAGVAMGGLVTVLGLGILSVLFPVGGGTVATLTFGDIAIAGTVFGYPMGGAFAATRVTGKYLEGVSKATYNCLKWTLEHLKNAGCEITLVSIFSTPETLVKDLRARAKQEGQLLVPIDKRNGEMIL